jgi:Ca2+-transporting ATPase
MEALKKLTALTAKVIRSAQEEIIPAREIVPGDLIRLEVGDSIPADARIAECRVFSTQEAALTGESQSISKTSKEIANDIVPIADRNNMVYAGTTVASGRALALVVATGQSSEMGQIAKMLEVKEEKTPLQKELKVVGKKITLLCLAISAIVIIAGIARGHPIAIMFLAGVSLAVAAIPEGLPAVITASLALGVQSMAKKNAVVRKLHAVETLGSTTVICSDKTGTLTQNQMSVRRIYFQNRLWEFARDGKVVDLGAKKEEPTLDLKPLLKIAVLCNDARKMQNGQVLGDPTETALISTGESIGLIKEELEEKNPRIAEAPFDSERKRMSTLHKSDDSYLVLVKGAPEEVLPHCKFILLKSEEKLTPKEQREILDANSNLAKEGFRNLAFAYKKLNEPPQEIKPDILEEDLVFVGLLGLTDPPRPEVYEAIKICKKAHINVAMITGDHRLTAESIAKEIGLLDGRKVITGSELEAMTLGDLEKELANIAVFARVDPKDKIKIIKAFREKGHIVGMTGDGINDAPAVKMADIGIAMGKVGTDVTREASDLVLTDDNFATIVTAIKEGRVIFDNIKKFILFLLSCNISEVSTMFFAMLVGLPLPLFPVQILWINLITDGLPALALGVDPADPHLMERPPRSKGEGILTPLKQKQIGWQGPLLAVGAISSFIISLLWLKTSLNTARSVVFTTLVLIQLLHALNFRSERYSLFSAHSLVNKYLVGAVFGSALLQIGVVYLPFLQPIFHTLPMGLNEWLVIGASCTLPIIGIDLIKRATARGKIASA